MCSCYCSGRNSFHLLLFPYFSHWTMWNNKISRKRSRKTYHNEFVGPLNNNKKRTFRSILWTLNNMEHIFSFYSVPAVTLLQNSGYPHDKTYLHPYWVINVTWPTGQLISGADLIKWQMSIAEPILSPLSYKISFLCQKLV